MLEKEFQYYLDHQQELVERYPQKFVVIVGNEVVGVFDTDVEAYKFATGKYDPGTFLIQQCLPGREHYTQTFNSRVVFE